MTLPEQNPRKRQMSDPRFAEPVGSRRAPDEPAVHVLSFDEMVDRMREPLAGLEEVIDELEPATADFVRGMRAALDRYDVGDMTPADRAALELAGERDELPDPPGAGWQE
jgi:hypothetical protein